MIEDDEDIREIALYALRTAKFETTGFENGEEFFTALTACDYTPDLIMLDIMLPGDDGLTILKKLRQCPQYKNLPIIMLTAKGSEHDKVVGLDLGADDYLSKPFGVMELISRVKALLRRSQNSTSTPSNELQYQCIQMNHTSRIVLVDGVVLNLTFKEYELLHYLLINTNIVLNRDKILETVWGYDFEGESRTLDMHIKSLRKKLGKAGEYIKTVRNVGYRLGE
ncbi:MAG: response regulator transcription factor [Defluviitaleaceae bacterium]|nr:response regulator transcription factor [Defluviitaleaceae bacterium]